jgi:hypothetical protein
MRAKAAACSGAAAQEQNCSAPNTRTAASRDIDEGDAAWLNSEGGNERTRDSMGAACNWQSELKSAFRPRKALSNHHSAKEFRRRFPLIAADQEKLAANFANEHESGTEWNDSRVSC